MKPFTPRLHEKNAGQIYYTVLTGQSFTLENLTLAEGQNTINAQALDLAGNKGAAITTVTLDTVNPQIFVTASANGLLTRNPQVTVSEPLATLSVNGQPVTVNGQALTTPANNQYLNARNVTVTVSGSIDDPTATVSVTSTSLSAGTSTKAATINGALFSVADVPLSEGDNTLTVIARDPAGNQTQSGVVVTVDTSLPQVTISTPVDGSFTNIPTVTVNGTVSESPESVQVNGRSATVTGQAFTLPQFPLAEGLNSLTVFAADYAGNEGTAIVTVNLDTVNPQIFISTPADGILTRNPQLTITGSVNEPVTSLTINGSVVALSPTLTFSSTLTLTGV